MSTEADIQQAIDSAFNQSSASLIYNQTASEEADTKRFILQSHSYYDLQAYLAVGVTLPPTVDRFTSDFPKDDFSELIALDSDIYNEMKNCLVNIFNHCNDFEAKGMGRFITVTGAIINFCDDFSKYVSGPGLLRDLIARLSDENLDSSDPVFVRSSKMAQGILKTLATRAKARETDCAALVNDLNQFLALTKADKGLVDTLQDKFVNGYNGKKPYGEILNADLAKLRSDAANLFAQYKAFLADWEQSTTVAATAVTYAGCFPFGTIAAAVVMGVYADRAIKAKEAYEGFRDQANATNATADRLANCIDHVTNVCTELANIETVVTAAVEALTGMRSMFGRMASDLQGLGEKFGSMSTTLDESDWFMRAMASVDLDAAVAQWADVKILALNFMTNAPIEWQGKLHA